MLARLRPHLLPLGTMILLTLGLFYRLVLNPTYGLYSEVNDLPALNMPLKYFLAASYQRTGEIPLWNPHVCAGMPFVHDSQTAAFYPFHVFLYVLPPQWMQATLSWLTVIHVIIAGWCMYAHALSTGLGRLASFTAGVGYMFSGKWLLHIVTAGHYPMIGLAWVPIMLMFLNLAVKYGSLSRATIAGFVYAIVILGSHPQVIFYTGLFAGLWSFGAALESAGWLGGQRNRSLLRALGWWMLAGFWCVAIAVLLSAVQLLPNLEVIPYTSRSAGMPSGESLLLAFWKTLQVIGPPMGDPFWENQGGLGAIWLAMAISGLILGVQRNYFYGFVAIIVVVYAIGGSALVQDLPGFNLFRCPGRFLWYLYVPASLLVGEVIQRMTPGKYDKDRVLVYFRIILLITVILAFGALGLLQARDRLVGLAVDPPQIYWPGSVIALGCLTYAVLRFFGQSEVLPALAISVILIADATVVIFPFIAVQDYNFVLRHSDLVSWLQGETHNGSRCLDRDYVDSRGKVFMGSGPVGLTLPMLTGLEPVRGWHSLDVLRYKEFLAFIAGRDRPFGQKDVVINFPIVNKNLLDSLAVRYIVQPSDPEFAVPGEQTIASDSRYRAVFRDDHPIGSYNVMSWPRITELPPYTVYENLEAFPRAWLVGLAVPAPERSKMLETLKKTDLRKTVLIEGLKEAEGSPLEMAACKSVLREPNRLIYRTRTDKPAFLVFSEVWFPGWRCYVDGSELQIYRANHAFRAVRVPEGEHEVVMVMDPASLRWGKWISLGTAILLASAGIVVGAVRWLRGRSAAT